MHITVTAPHLQKVVYCHTIAPIVLAHLWVSSMGNSSTESLSRALTKEAIN